MKFDDDGVGKGAAGGVVIMMMRIIIIFISNHCHPGRSRFDRRVCNLATIGSNADRAEKS